MTTCRDCGREWTGLKEIHCICCHRQFSTESNFDLHRPNGVCVDPANVADRKKRPRMHARNGPNGVTWVGRPGLPFYEEVRVQ